MSNDKIDQLKQFAAKDLEQTKATFSRLKIKSASLEVISNKKVRKLWRM